jgi:predicted dehydrogenase
MRFAVIGVGANVFKMHAPALHSPEIEVVAVADVNLAAAEYQAEAFGCPAFADHRAMLAATHPEATVVLAPHPFHASLAIDCLEAGAHVLVEKPLADEVAEADRMIAAAQRANRLLAVNLQHRTRAEIRTAKTLIEQGRLGDLQRVEMVAIWTRTASYYAMAGWRGTWQGEGGGVLMNQSPHSLDLVCHLAGQPSRVAAWNRTLFHAIETEDTSLSMLEWPNGALGTLLVSTAQAGEAERLEIAGTRGALQLTRGGLASPTFTRARSPSPPVVVTTRRSTPTFSRLSRAASRWSRTGPRRASRWSWRMR